MQIIYHRTFPYLRTLILSILIIVLSTSVFAGVIDAKKNRLDDRTAQLRLDAIEPSVDLPFTRETKRLLDIYTYSYLPGARRIVERSNPYFDQYDHMLDQKGLPKVLKNIAIVESNMDPWSFSSRGAVGVWQLMRTTAKSHGLIIDRYVDERFDPLLASKVAFDYLDELHQEFEDWNLALVAYNFGPTALRKAMRHCNSEKYEIVKGELPRESTRYASRLAAAAYLNIYYQEHAKSKRNHKNDHVELAGIPVYEYITFDEIARITGLDRQDIVEYNPAVTYDYLPANSKGYTINLPSDKMMALISEKEWNARDILNFEYHKTALEKLMPYHSSFKENIPQNNDSDEDTSIEDLFPFLALRREQILQMLSLG